MRGKRWLDRTAGEYVAIIVRAGRVVAVLAVGYVAWAGAIGDAFPPDQRAIAKAKEHWKSVALVALATFYGTVSIDGVIRWLRPTGPNVKAANSLNMGVQDIYAASKGPYADKSMRSAAEQVLAAAQYAVEELLGVEGSDELQANLIWKKDDQTIQVVARSKPGDCPVDYKWAANLMACKAMETNTTCVQTHARQVQGFDKKPYDAVAAIPISYRNRAFGAITIDSKRSKVLDGQELVLDRALRPYAAILLLTREKNAPSHECGHHTVR
jgi:hypothetical protein